MERIEYDPEIDPSIREEREEAEREREMSARIRIEIERYVKENDLVPKGPGEETDGAEGKAGTEGAAGDDGENEEPAKKSRRELKEEKREAKREEKARRAKNSRKTFQSIFTGNILNNELIRKLFPYMLGFAVLLLLYIANVFYLQRQHRNQQRLENDIRELSIKAVGYSAERAAQTKRSEIVIKLRDKGILLKEYPHPLKTIDPK